MYADLQVISFSLPCWISRVLPQLRLIKNDNYWETSICQILETGMEKTCPFSEGGSLKGKEPNE